MAVSKRVLQDQINWLSCSLMPTAVILGNVPQPSFKIMGELFRKSFEGAGLTVFERGIPATLEERLALQMEFSGQNTIFFHNTSGSGFQVIPGARNIALPAYEFSRLPDPWARLLNDYTEVWVTTSHVRDLLKKSGVSVPILRLPPALDREELQAKRSYEPSRPFRFLFAGESRSEEGVHFLMHGFLRAFPQMGDAELTIKTDPASEWASPRQDIMLVNERLSREELLRLCRDSDCYISSSLGESLDLPLATAILCGLPVCANYWGGHRDLLIASGFFPLDYRETDRPWTGAPQLYTPGQKCALSDETAVAEAMLKIYHSSPGKRGHMAEKARRYLLKSYGAEVLEPFWQVHVMRLWGNSKVQTGLQKEAVSARM